MKKSTTAQKTKQTAKATNVVTSKAVVKQEKTEAKKTKFSHLATNVTGKEFQETKRNANKEFKKYVGSYLKCLKYAVKFLDEQKAFEKLQFVSASDFDTTNSQKLPINLVHFLTESEKNRVNKADKTIYPKGKYSVWLLMNLIERYAKHQATKQIIIKK
jgi:hypothetical protein